ncbi:MAG: hypothetical protein OXT07_00860 [bacterium]|nr:hypothetical protein [bacterium]
MESSSDIVNLIIALATAIPALVAAAVGIVKANHAQRQIAVMLQNSQQKSVQVQANPQSSEASGVGQFVVNVGQREGVGNE